MASIDYIEAKKEIEKAFSHKEKVNRKIIFWYDAPANFKDDIACDTFSGCRVLICNYNDFTIKKIIEKEDTDSNILVYVPYEKPEDTQNWLLDILMYSEEYYADTVALTMRRLGLSNSDLRRVIDRYANFFNAEARNKKLGNYIEISDSMHSDDLIISMMSVLVRSSARSIESVLQELVFDDTQVTKYNELKRYGFEEFLWDQIAQAYNYEGEQKVEVLIKRFMFTAMLEQKAEFDDLPSYYKQFILTGNGRTDAKFFVDRMKSDKRYENLQLGLSLEMKIEQLLLPRDISCVKNADIFECIDTHIIKTIAESLKNGSLDYDSFGKIIAERINSMWYYKHKSEYELLIAGISFFRLSEKSISTGLSSIDYIKNYTDSYYQRDTDYRHICYYYRTLENPTIEFEQLLDRVELTYQEKFLSVLGKNFSDSLKANGENWNFIGIPKLSTFYQGLQRIQTKKMFVIISDAMRFEVGKEILDNIKKDSLLNGSVDMSYSVTPIPSETRFGMASLLPHVAIDYENRNVTVDGLQTNSLSNRNEILRLKNTNYCAITYEEINGYSRNELRAFMIDKTLVYIYHNTIDEAGHHNENKVFDVAQTAIQEILSLVKKLYNNLQIANFFITADHGFLYRRNRIEESQKYGDIVSLQATETTKRYIITDNNQISIPYTLEFNLNNVSGGRYKVITPYSYDIFKTQGGGLQYVHGGASLQEIIVPVIHISELRSTKAKDTAGPVGVRLKSIVRKITNRSFTLDFEQYEKVEAKKYGITCETYLVDEFGEKVSGEYKFVANSSSDDAQTRITKMRYTLKNIEFDRNNKYFLILKNVEKADEYIEKEQFVIDILGLITF